MIFFLLLVILSTSSHALIVDTTSCSNDQDRNDLAMALANALVASDSGITVTGAEIAGDCVQFGTLISTQFSRMTQHTQQLYLNRYLFQWNLRNVGSDRIGLHGNTVHRQRSHDIYRIRKIRIKKWERWERCGSSRSNNSWLWFLQFQYEREHASSLRSVLQQFKLRLRLSLW